MSLRQSAHQVTVVLIQCPIDFLSHYPARMRPFYTMSKVGCLNFGRVPAY